jgi:endonuclease III
MADFDRAYYEDRAVQERAMASASSDRRAAAAHRAMATRYEALANGDDVSDEKSLKKLVQRLTLTREREKRLSDIDAELIDRSETAIEESRQLLRGPIEGLPRGKPTHSS